MIKPGIYKHYKGNKYKVHFIALHSENEEEMVVYECLYNNPLGQFWVRPLTMFTETVEVNNVRQARFEYLGDE